METSAYSEDFPFLVKSVDTCGLTKASQGGRPQPSSKTEFKVDKRHFPGGLEAVKNPPGMQEMLV